MLVELVVEIALGLPLVLGLELSDVPLVAAFGLPFVVVLEEHLLDVLELLLVIPLLYTVILYYYPSTKQHTVRNVYNLEYSLISII